MSKILVINGPNLQQLGEREPEIYGDTTLAGIEQMLVKQGRSLHLEVSCYQSNTEGAIIDRIYQAKEAGVRGIIINPGAYTHTSIAIRDCLAAVSIPAVEVHLSNIYAREPFRQKSYTSGVVVGQVTGFGPFSYLMALSAIHNILEEEENEDDED